MNKIKFAIASLLFCTILLGNQVLAQDTVPSLSDYYVMPPVWNTQGTLIAVASGANVEIWEPSVPTLIDTLLGHTDDISAIAWNSQGTQIATGSFDTTVRIWNNNSGHFSLACTLTDHDSVITALAWDGTRLISLQALGSLNLFVWDTTDCTAPISSYSGPSSSAIAFNPSGSLLAYATGGGSIAILDANTFDRLLRYQTYDDRTNLMYSLAWSSDASQIITGSVGGTAYVWDAATLQPIDVLVANSNYVDDPFGVQNPQLSWVRDVAFSSDGQRILAASADGTLRAWDITINHNIVETRQIESLMGASWSPSGEQIALISQNNNFRVEDTSDLAIQQSISSSD